MISGTDYDKYIVQIKTYEVLIEKNKKICKIRKKIKGYKKISQLFTQRAKSYFQFVSEFEKCFTNENFFKIPPSL